MKLRPLANERLLRLARASVNFARCVRPAAVAKRLAVGRQRRLLDGELAKVPQLPAGYAAGNVLLDASWDNPNYWYRITLLRSGLGLASRRETAVLGPYRTREAGKTARALGLSDVRRFQAYFPPRAKLRRDAEALLSQLSTPQEMIEAQLPFGFPGNIVYDGLLKRQRLAEVDLHHPEIVSHMAEALGSIHAAHALVDSVDPQLVILSHAIEFRYGSLAWCALQRGAEVVVAFGNYGSPRYARLSRAEDIYNTTDRPTALQIDQLANRGHVAAEGKAYLDRRLNGQTDDLGARYAFAKQKRGLSRETICSAFGWNPSLPIVSVYASNWFDYPHAFGMNQFADFLDWLKQTLDVAVNTPRCNWLFRAHPCDEWYGGVTLSHLMLGAPANHVRLSPTHWNGADIQRATDGLVTVHGTAGVEYAAAGKPVLLADRGWYHDLGFAYLPRDREAYLSALSSLDWLNASSTATASRANVFAAIYFCPPSQAVSLGDDSEQDLLQGRLIDMLRDNAQGVLQEANDVAAWWASAAPHFHSWRITQKYAERSRRDGDEGTGSLSFSDQLQPGE